MIVTEKLPDRRRTEDLWKAVLLAEILPCEKCNVLKNMSMNVNEFNY